MPDPIELIPLDAILADALTRDRTALDPAALDELTASITATGLRMPIEVFALAEPVDGCTWGLISGFRRLAAYRRLHAMALDKTRFPAIPAFVRAPASIAAAMTAMAEENAIRADVSPWEQAMLAVTARDRGLFDTIDAAIETLYVSLHRDKRRRIRVIAQIIETLDARLAAPETWSLRRLLRLAAAINRGFAPVIQHALEEHRARDADSQWRLLQPILAESENPDIPAPYRDRDGYIRPRRTLVAPLHSLRIRRERTPEGWCLHFTGRDAHGAFIDTVFDTLENLLGPA